MAPRPRDNAAALDLGQRLSDLYKHYAAGKSYPQVARELERLHEVSMSDETCRKFHDGKVDPHSARIEDLRGWTLYYGVAPAALGFIAARRLQLAFALFSGQGPDDGGSDQAIPSSRCIVQLRAA